MPKTTLSPAELPLRARRSMSAPPGVDQLTWAPRDYDAFGRHFRDMTVAHMRRALEPVGATEEDVQDAASQMMARFVANDGLAMYDPGMVHHAPPGGWRGGGREPRVAQFPGMYSGYLRRSGPGLRDAFLRRAKVERPLPPADEGAELAADEGSGGIAAVDAVLTVSGWLDRAEARLWAAGRGDLVPVLDGVRAHVLAGDDARPPAVLLRELAAAGFDADSLRAELAA